MIPVEKLRAVVKGLLEKTASGQARWLYDEEENYGCALYLPNALIRVLRKSPAAEPDSIRLVIEDLSNEDPHTVAEWEVQEGDRDWDLLHDLYDKASRVVYHWDKVLAEVETAVNSAGPIGLAEAELSR
jgi:hypothetical protein